MFDTVGVICLKALEMEGACRGVVAVVAVVAEYSSAKINVERNYTFTHLPTDAHTFTCAILAARFIAFFDMGLPSGPMGRSSDADAPAAPAVALELDVGELDDVRSAASLAPA